MAIAEATAYTRRCEKTTKKLAEMYGWQLDTVTEFARGAAIRLASDSRRVRADNKAIERACLSEYFARLYDKLVSGSDRDREDAARQLFDSTPGEEGPVEAAARGYVVKVALRFVGSWRRKYALKLSEDRTREIALDAASLALASIVSNISSCRSRDLFWGWSTRIIENAVVDEMRKLRKERVAGDQERVFTPDPAGKIVDDLAVAHEFIRKCRIGELSPEQRVTLYKSFWQDAPLQEIADAIAAKRGSVISAANVSVWKTRGLRVMAKNLQSVGFR